MRDADDLGLPTTGRVVTGHRVVRMAEVGPDRRAHLDALARYLHDVAEDDAAQAALPATIGWVLRSTQADITRFPTLGEELTLHTYCSATARRWAERTTIVRGSKGAALRAVSIWVAVDMATGAPARLGEDFFTTYGPSAQGRRASARLVLEPPEETVARRARPWSLRRADVDAWGHVNNAIAWAALEDVRTIGTDGALLVHVEHHASIDLDAAPMLVTHGDGDGQRVWLVRGDATGQLLVAARLLWPRP